MKPLFRYAKERTVTLRLKVAGAGYWFNETFKGRTRMRLTFFSVGESGEELIKVLLVYALWKESNDSEEVTGVEVKFEERWRSEGEPDGHLINKLEWLGKE